jgi:NADH:ubiquinone oxidoreductase subunit C
VRTTAVTEGGSRTEKGGGDARTPTGPPGGFEERVLRELAKLPAAVIEASVTRPRRMLATAKAEMIVDVCRTLQKTGFEHLSSITCVDYDAEMQVIYHLWSYKQRCLIEIRAIISGTEPKISSVTPVWAGAEFHEREAYDMFGVLFEGCPNLKRVLLPDEWSVFPLRKSFKVESIHEKRKRLEAEKAKAAKAAAASAAAPVAAPASEPTPQPKSGGTPNEAPPPTGGGAP